jgi:predicted  nucleic acid-binding Zn-ribbon protein
MNEHLVILLEIQDLTSKAREIESGEMAELELEHFSVVPTEAADRLRVKATELEEELPAPIRQRLRRIAGHVDRAVVPVIGGTCFGCFVSIPTATAGEDHPNADLRVCENCGRFIYILN